MAYDFYISNKECKESAKDCLRGSYAICAKTTLVYYLIIVGLILATVLFSTLVSLWFLLPFLVLDYIMFCVLSYGYNVFCLKLAKSEEVQIKDLFSGFSKKFKNILNLGTKRFFLGLTWLILLIVPFFIKNIGYSMSTLLLIDNEKVNSSNALKESLHLMKQNYIRYVKFLFSHWWHIILSIITLGIAGLWLAPMIGTAKALFYENLKTDF